MLRAEAELTDPQKALNGERGEDGRQQLDPFPSPVEGGSSLRAYEDKVLLSLSLPLRSNQTQISQGKVNGVG